MNKNAEFIIEIQDSSNRTSRSVEIYIKNMTDKKIYILYAENLSVSVNIVLDLICKINIKEINLLFIYGGDSEATKNHMEYLLYCEQKDIPINIFSHHSPETILK